MLTMCIGSVGFSSRIVLSSPLEEELVLVCCCWPVYSAYRCIRASKLSLRCSYEVNAAITPSLRGEG